MNKRLVLGKIINNIGLNFVVRKLRNNNLIVINYHRISGANHHTDFDDDVFEHTAEVFRKQILWLKKNFDLIDQATLIELVSTGSFNFKGNAVLITFDDGYIDNYTLAYPILKEFGVPAIFFVPYSSIEDRKVGWWDSISWMVGKTALKRADYSNVKLDFTSAMSRSVSAKRLHSHLKVTPDSETKTLVAEMSKVLDVELPSLDRQSEELMSWGQLKEVAANGIAVGSHSISHRLLSQISDEAQSCEIKDSKRLIEEKLGLPVDTIAYPVGQKTSFNSVTKRLAQEAGYKVAFSFYPGSYSGSIDDLYDVRRIALSSETDVYMNELVFPSLFFRT
jgi:peptidoglycan/xylan/chitin deacetylase (PgdA/CDA1 family)